jgi:broad specificity phosphatase PhoE
MRNKYIPTWNPSAYPNQQAQAVGKAFSGVKIDYIYASPLLRAYATGKAVHDAQPSPQPPFTANPNLREQHFGIGEGQPWVEVPAGRTEEELIANNLFPVLSLRSAKFPEGESLDDLARRAEVGVKECVVPHVLEDGVHIVIASHGLCISELIAALLRLDPDSRRNVSYTGLLNTAWTRVTISVKVAKLYPLGFWMLICSVGWSRWIYRFRQSSSTCSSRHGCEQMGSFSRYCMQISIIPRQISI